MKITRFFESADNGCEFEDINISFPDTHADAFGHVLQLSRAFSADCLLATLPADLDQDWHNAPNRQLVFVLSGRLEVENTHHEIRQWSAGGLFMADDTGGQGHRTRVLDGPVQLLFVRLPDDFDLAAWTRQ